MNSRHQNGVRPLAARILQQKAGSFHSRFSLLCGHHHVAVGTFYAHNLCPSHAVVTAGANILDAVAVGVTSCRLARGVPCALATRGVEIFNAVHADVLPVLFQNELTQRVGRLGDAPSNARVVTDFQIAGLGGLLKFFVVYCYICKTKK